MPPTNDVTVNSPDRSLFDSPHSPQFYQGVRIDSLYGLGLIKHGLQSLVEQGLIARQPVEPLAHLLLGAINEAGMMIAGSKDVDTARKVVGQSLDHFLQGLRF